MVVGVRTAAAGGRRRSKDEKYQENFASLRASISDGVASPKLKKPIRCVKELLERRDASASRAVPAPRRLADACEGAPAPPAKAPPRLTRQSAWCAVPGKIRDKLLVAATPDVHCHSIGDRPPRHPADETAWSRSLKRRLRRHPESLSAVASVRAESRPVSRYASV